MDQFDSQHLWHPYTSLKKPLPSYLVSQASGVHIQLATGQKLVDGMASWWCMIHGYNHAVLNQAAQMQMQKMSHVMFGGLTHAPAIELGKNLLAITPSELEYIFYSDSGSVAVEVAMKMAIQYWRAKGQRKSRFLSFKKGYHGDTLGAMSVSDPNTGMHSEFNDYIPQHHYAPAPPLGFTRSVQNTDLQALKELLEAKHQELAALIIEPIVQGAGGMRIYSPDYLEALVKLAKQYQVLVIFDEIATGFGRTGKLFASDHITLQPDILCLGKALTGGYMSMAATLCNQKVVTAINDHGDGTFMHGPTFMANPLACAVANASIELLLAQNWQAEVKRIESALQMGLTNLQQHAQVKDVRILGAIGVLELHEPVDLAKIQRFFVEQGVWLRPFGSLLYLMPPFIISDEQIAQLCMAISAWLDQNV